MFLCELLLALLSSATNTACSNCGGHIIMKYIKQLLLPLLVLLMLLPMTMTTNNDDDDVNGCQWSIVLYCYD